MRPDGVSGRIAAHAPPRDVSRRWTSQALGVVVIEPDPARRAVLAALLGSDQRTMYVCGTASDWHGGWELVDRLRPAAVLCRVDSTADLEWVSRLAATTRVAVAVTDDDGRAYRVIDALRAGASGVVASRSDVADALDVVRQTLAGRLAVHRAFVDDGVVCVCPTPSSARSRSTIGLLTRREREVLDLLSEGLRPREIAARLFLSTRTVEFYLGRAYRKLGVSGRIDALRAYGRLPSLG